MLNSMLMLPKEAVEIIKIVHDNFDFPADYYTAFENAIEALEKQVPKEPTHEATKFECFTCPTCKNVVDEFTDFIGQKVRVELPYCKLCGQKLKWGEDD